MPEQAYLAICGRHDDCDMRVQKHFSFVPTIENVTSKELKEMTFPYINEYLDSWPLDGSRDAWGKQQLENEIMMQLRILDHD